MQIETDIWVTPQVACSILGEELDSSGELYLICKYGGYYRPNSRGYTDKVSEAGRYTLSEAIIESHPNGPSGSRDGITYTLAPEFRAKMGKEQ